MKPGMVFKLHDHREIHMHQMMERFTWKGWVVYLLDALAAELYTIQGPRRGERLRGYMQLSLTSSQGHLKFLLPEEWNADCA